MRRLSIAEQLDLLASETLKQYFTSIESDGFEMGIGRAGSYAGHAHRYLWDIVYCPRGFELETADGSPWSGRLLVVAPETFYGPIVLGPFWFIKFSGQPGPISLPDKVTERLGKGGLWVFNGAGSGLAPWYRSNCARPASVTFNLYDSTLAVNMGGHELVVEP